MRAMYTSDVDGTKVNLQRGFLWVAARLITGVVLVRCVGARGFLLERGFRVYMDCGCQGDVTSGCACGVSRIQRLSRNSPAVRPSLAHDGHG